MDTISIEPQTRTGQPVLYKRSFESALRWLRSPLWLCLLLALGVRIWLVLHTNGFMDADEALVGVQAQHILQGERPIYYYGQPYMGSLEAYLLAGIFALVGPSFWAVRALPIALSLLLVALTWRVADELADYAKLSPSIRRWYLLVAGVLAACPPLYNLVMVMRVWGGHIEIYLLMLGLLYSGLRLTRRWEAVAENRELAWRWGVIGLIIGLGLWIYPLIVCAVLAFLAWLAIFIGWRLWLLRRDKSAMRESWRDSCSKLVLALYSIPGCLFGFAPGIYWAIQHNWENVLYLLAPGSDGGNSASFLSHHPDRFALFVGTVQLYGRCLVPEVFGGVLPAQALTMSSVFSFGLLTVLGVGSLFITVGLVGISVLRQNAHLEMLRRLVGLPLLFALSTIFIFCFSSTVGGSVFEPCTRDGVGRYAAPILLALPLLGAALWAFGASYLAQKGRPAIGSAPKNGDSIAQEPSPSRLKISVFLLPVLLCLLVLGNTYVRSDGRYVFQSFTCLHAPVDNEPVIDYMEQHNIHYAWGTITLSNAILFKTRSKIVVSDPRIVLYGALNRLPENVEAVKNAPRASLLDMVPRVDQHPLTLQMLERANILYQVARFPIEPGEFDLLVITPLNRTLAPSEASSYGLWSMRC